MDWYDLERSKRIKAFRCSEHDECIKKAKASALRPNKADRTGRYARREDAIIHALELEQIHGCNGDWDFYSGLIQPTEMTDKQGVDKEQSDNRKRTMKAKGKRTMEVSPPVNSSEHSKTARGGKVRTVKKTKWRTLSDDVIDVGDGIQEITHMKGLDDLGSKVKSRSVSGIINGTISDEQYIVDDLSVTGTNFNSFSYMGSLNCMKGIHSQKRQRKELQRTEVPKRKNRHRPLTKVLESTARVILPTFYSHEDSPRLPGKHSLPGATQNKFVTLNSSESKKTDLSVVINNSSECSENSCDDVSGAHKASNGFAVDEICFPFTTDFPSTFTNISDGFFDDLFDVPVHLEESYGEEFYHMISSPKSENVCNESQIINGSVSTLLLNERKKAPEGIEGWTKGIIPTTDPSVSFLASHDGISDFEYKIDDNLMDRLLEFDNNIPLMQCGLVSSMKGKRVLEPTPQAPDIDCISSVHDCETSNLANCSKMAGHENNIHELPETNGMQEESPNSDIAVESFASENIAHHNLNLEDVLPSYSNLFEVKVDIQVMYRSSQVPLVSMTSRLNGKAIVGHPITVMIMESGSSDALLLRRYVATGVAQMQSRKIMSKEAVSIVDVYKFSEQTGSVSKMQSQSKCRRKNPGKRHGDTRFPSTSRRKSLKVRKPKFSPRKIRKLSSITFDGGMKGKLVEQMKDRSGPPVVGCVPTRLVFNRLSEALGCLPK